MSKKRVPNAKRLARAFDEYMDECGFSFDQPGFPGLPFDELIPRLPAALEEMQLSPWACDELSVPDGSSYARGFRTAARRFEEGNAEGAVLEVLEQATISGLWNEAATEIAEIAIHRLSEYRFHALSTRTHCVLFSNMGDGSPHDLALYTFRMFLTDLGVEELGFGQNSDLYSWAMIVNASSKDELLEALRKSF